MVKDYYAILGVSRDATVQEIRDRFRDLAREQHPDRFQGDEKVEAETEFQAITQAFNILSSAEGRRLHDLELARPETQQSGVDKDQLIKVFMQRGVKAYKEKNYFAAAESFNRATKEDGGNPRAWQHLALALSHQRRWLSRAVGAITKACELEPRNPTYLKLAGRLCAEAGMLIRAERYYTEALQWLGEDDEIRNALDELKKAEKKGKAGLFGLTD
jgi:curved DNA-binding protein CbpA